MRRRPVSVSSEKTSTSTSSDVRPGRRHARLENDQVADLDGMEELQAIDRRRDQRGCACDDGRRSRRRCR